MLLTARMLDNVVDVNTWEYAESLKLTEGDAPAIYFQLIDASKDRSSQGYYPSGRRYCPATGATLNVTLDNIDDDRIITRAATQHTTDKSIWYITTLTADALKGTINLKLTLTEGTKITYGFLSNAISVESLTGRV
jgi:hypothetical protein